MTQTLADRIDDATEIAVSFDTTGSMSPAIADVRKHLEETFEGLFANIPGLKVGLIAHGDYCDGENCIRSLKLTNDKGKIFDFIRNAPNTSGGDADECYELALHTARDLGWGTGAKALVLIGDAEPHGVDYPANEGKLDWRVELAALKEMGVRVFPLQCLQNSDGRFWAEVATLSETSLMQLNEFCESAMTLEGFAYATAGSKAFATYESKMGGSFCCSADMSRRMDTLRKEAATYDAMKEKTK